MEDKNKAKLIDTAEWVVAIIIVAAAIKLLHIIITTGLVVVSVSVALVILKFMLGISCMLFILMAAFLAVVYLKDFIEKYNRKLITKLKDRNESKNS